MKQAIINALDEINCPERVQARMLNRQTRLQTLTDQYGITNVALASGLSEATLKQYLRVKRPTVISEHCVEQAEKVFQLVG